MFIKQALRQLYALWHSWKNFGLLEIFVDNFVYNVTIDTIVIVTRYKKLKNWKEVEAMNEKKTQTITCPNCHYPAPGEKVNSLIKGYTALDRKTVKCRACGRVIKLK